MPAGWLLADPREHRQWCHWMLIGAAPPGLLGDAVHEQ